MINPERGGESIDGAITDLREISKIFLVAARREHAFRAILTHCLELQLCEMK